ncbi:ABC transporter, ATPase subunit [Candidatus Koribacter versatilis Ellin345]|uniref:ABC transporter, ATPase subunit n=1 Tax=Koribacter versatilis (strain Ellin345) TaxID=204669 RepID=Q1IP95_KORVE|nr:ABC transporter ATP-binding protein [Candidatus Koribacter versatilis]ABF41305.1 ABC transporter, ATPase subunit [Candidatus Koribacter versatilis Ellin345]
MTTSTQPIATEATAAVSLKDIVKFFGRFVALRHVSAEFESGKLYVILGDNGAGKSTLLRVMTGLLKPSYGEVKLLGEAPCERAQRFGYMGHAPLLYDELTGVENLSYFAGLYGMDADEKVKHAILTVGLDPDLDRRVGNYSQGMRQRMSLARSIIHNPDVLFLDEPFSNVDIKSAQDMAALLGTMRNAGKTLFVVTHQPAVLEDVADQYIVMNSGQIIERRKEYKA